jgi:hypothetical protein
MPIGAAAPATARREKEGEEQGGGTTHDVLA